MHESDGSSEGPAAALAVVVIPKLIKRKAFFPSHFTPFFFKIRSLENTNARPEARFYTYVPPSRARIKTRILLCYIRHP